MVPIVTRGPELLNWDIVEVGLYAHGLDVNIVKCELPSFSE